MADLTGKNIDDVYKDFLQVSNGNQGVDGTLRRVSDGEGTESALSLSESEAKVTGDLEVTGTLTAPVSGLTGAVPVANGGTGATSAANARTNLGVAIGSDVQAYSSVLANTTASFLVADETKLDGIEASADVTDATNVAAAGAVMDGDFDSNGVLVRTGAGAYNNRTITGTTDEIDITNGDGVSGNPVVGLSSSITDAWTSYTPTITAGSGTPTTVSASGAYLQIGKIVVYRFEVTITTVGTASGFIGVSLPVNSLAGFYSAGGAGMEVNVTGHMAKGIINTPGGHLIQVTRYDNASLWGSGRAIKFTATYEAA